MKYKIGYRYSITENGVSILGKILSYDDSCKKYKVWWQDGEITEEDEASIR